MFPAPRSPVNSKLFLIGGSSAQKLSTRNHSPRRVNRISLSVSMQLHVTTATHQLQIIPVQRYRWIIDVVRSDMDFMVNDFTRRNDAILQTFFTQPAHAGSIGIPAPLPGLTFVKAFGIFFRHEEVLPSMVRSRPQQRLTGKGGWNPLGNMLPRTQG